MTAARCRTGRATGQRLGLEAHASDLNPVAVLINKAMIEIPPKFAGRPAVNQESQGEPTVIAKTWRGAQGLAEDVRHYGQWMRKEAEKRIGHLYPPVEVTSALIRERPAAAADRVRHGAVPAPYQLDEQRQPAARVRAGRPGRRVDARPADVGVLRIPIGCGRGETRQSQASPSEHLLLPLMTALERELGHEPRVAREVDEVAQDIQQKLKALKENRRRGVEKRES